MTRSRFNANASTVAVKAGQRQVLKRLPAAQSERDDMIDREAYILPLFGDMAVFTQILRPLTDLLL